MFILSRTKFSEIINNNFTKDGSMIVCELRKSFYSVYVYSCLLIIITVLSDHLAVQDTIVTPTAEASARPAK